jgi:hypothetical protein
LLAKQRDWKAISVRQPWAHAILHLRKDVENRPWRTHYRGPILIHAGLGIDRDDDARALKVDPLILPRGQIVGSVEVVDCVDDSPSRWAIDGQWHWILRNPRYLKTPIPFKGKLGFMRVPATLLDGKRFHRA